MLRPVNGELLLANDRSAFSGFQGCEELEAFLHCLKFTSESASSAQGRREASKTGRNDLICLDLHELDFVNLEWKRKKQNTAYLALCSPNNTDALLEFSHVFNGTKTRQSQRLEPTPGQARCY